MDAIADFAVSPFLADGEDFAKVLEAKEFDRDVFIKFNNLSSSYKNAYTPLSLLLKPIANMCWKEAVKLSKQINILQEICEIYKSVGNVIQKKSTSKEERCLAKTTLTILATKLDEHHEQMRHWHLLLKNKLLDRHQSRKNAINLINEIY